MKKFLVLSLVLIVSLSLSAKDRVDRDGSVKFVEQFFNLPASEKEEIATERGWVKFKIPYVNNYLDMIPKDMLEKMPADVREQVIEAAEEKEMEFPFEQFNKMERWIPSPKDMPFVINYYIPDKKSDVKFGNGDGVNSCDFSVARKGDVLLVHNGFVAWGWHAHAGIFYGGTGVYATIESNANQNYFGDPRPGVHFEPISHWNNDYDYCRIMRVNTWPLSTSYRAKAAEYARAQLGKPYNFNWLWKWATDKFYCSQLVWAGYYRTSKWYARINIDANPADTWVAPDELYASWRTWTVTSSW
ncbi:hypothetical protein TTHT_1854 [Thermotomaculum hydrothermale]|uniref:Permuted papain-like amidase enzyme, YaeF/YiiX, C92 family n=1 Tax=Thermotomaculum hydrothermale TaxID=981385 RepID=A0A7R6PS26_9BACT|nr:YiiX/YebB-like N1pC/P60 family cysteine hydrolase [Thermotomaculum hydrothermale]BBB33311.1 hypothetical protein TTHT_1854 [Thermotomaculum hydrothermale]